MKLLRIAPAVLLLLVSLVVLAYALSSSSVRALGYSAAFFVVLAFFALGVLVNLQRERLHAVQRALSRSRIRAQAVIEASPDGVVLVHETRITQANPAFRAMFALPSDEAIAGRDLMTLVSEEDQQRFREWITHRQAGSVEPDRLDFSGMRMSGARIALEASCALVPSRKGKQLALFLRDVSSRTTLEMRARHLERIETLADAAGEFVGEFEKVYHRIRRMIRESDGASPDLLERIDRAATRGAALSRRARALTPAATEHASHRPVDLARLLGEVCADYLRSLPGAITLKIHSDSPEVNAVSGEPAQLRQAIWHLLENAAQAQQEGEIGIRTRLIELDAAKASQRPGSHPGRYIVLEVRDTGPGMDEDTRSRAFSPFFSTKGKRASGLGLTLVFGVVRAHGGFVELDTELGRGTIARLAFPALAEKLAPETSVAPERGDGHWRGRETVLVVDDDALARQDSARILESFGYLVELASTPRDALQRLRKRPAIDLVLLDMVLPGWNGPDVLQRIIRHWPGQRVLMVSPYPLPEQEELAFSYGAVGIYLKPLVSPGLARAVREALDQPPPASMLTGPL